MSKFLYDVHTKTGEVLHKNLTLEEVAMKTGLHKSTIAYRATHPNHGSRICITRKDMFTGKTDESIRTGFPQELLKEWDKVYLAAQLIKSNRRCNP